MPTRCATHLMFQGTANAALEYYARIFPQFRVDHITRYEAGETGPVGSVKRADARLGDHHLVVIDSPVQHAFTFTPSMSLFVDCESAEELDLAFASLSAGGAVLMPVNEYTFSQRFGWCSDRFGVSWQLNLPSAQ